MENGSREAVYDSAAGLEAFRFRGYAETFPVHFHEHYVLGLVEDGQRELICGGKRRVVGRGCVLFFRPGESHGCVQCGGALDYRGMNIPEGAMRELTCGGVLPRLEKNVLWDAELCEAFRGAHGAVMARAPEAERRKRVGRLLGLLTRLCGEGAGPDGECRSEVAEACDFIRRSYAGSFSLDGLCRHVGLSRAALERAFAGEKGISPRRYLESVRVTQAKRLLARGVSACECAARTGFSDQSHFTNRFRALTGLSPGMYGEIFRNKEA